MSMVNSFADLIRYAALLDPETMLLKDGCFMCGFAYTGMDLDAVGGSERSYLCELANQAIKRLGGGYMYHFETLRTTTKDYPKSDFSERVTALIDHERRRQNEKEGSRYETRSYFFITWQPPIEESKSFLTKAKSVVSGQQGYFNEARLEDFKSTCRDIMYALSSVIQPRPLAGQEFLSVINACVNGKFLPKAEMPDIPWELDNIFARDVEIGMPLLYDNKYMAAITIDGLPGASYAGILSDLTRLPYEYRWSCRYIPQDYKQTFDKMTALQRKWASKIVPFMAQMLNTQTARINKAAAVAAEDVNDALEELESHAVSFGYFTSTIILRSHDEKLLNAMVSDVIRTLEEYMFGARLEHINTLEAFLGSLPGHGAENVRKPMISSLNFSHFLPLGSIWSGLPECPCPFYPPGSPPLLQAASSGGNPFRLNLHVGDVGHTLVLGPTGSGKSTLLATLAAQFDRYPGSQVFVFDKGRSMYPLFAAIENSAYYYLGSQDTPPLCPLADLDSPADITWCKEFVETLVLLNNGKITPASQDLIEQALHSMSRATKESHQRTLSALRTNIMDTDLQAALNTYTMDGTYGCYLDGDSSEIQYAKYTGFELEDLMRLGEQVVTPTLLYLFHEIEKRLDGRPTLIIIDECWLALSNPLFARQIKEWLVVLRKANAAVVLATQSLTQIIDSPISGIVFESCPTKILLPNPDARTDTMKDIYIRKLNMSEAEISVVANAVRKEDYFLLSPNGNRLFSLNIGPVALSFTGAAGREDLKAIEALAQSYGPEWPVHWLEQRKIDYYSDWAAHWHNIQTGGSAE